MPTLPYDPVCKEAMAEIQAIVRKHNLGASIHLVSPTHSEYAYELPPWGCLSWQHGPNGEVGLRVRCKR